ncbi:MAG: VCBS repeat-containing protein, partial [Anaerolineae bacterium]
YLNDGRGGFPTTITGTITLSNSSLYTSVIAVADLNGDGWLDVLALAPQGPAQLYLNAHQEPVTATLKFTTTQVPTITAPLAPVLAIGDLDGDADFDLVIGGESTLTRVYTNGGQANFSLAAAWLTATEATGATALALADVNRDDRLDLVLGFDGRPAQVFLNQDRAGFIPANTIGEARGRVAALIAGDLNGDLTPDLAIAYLRVIGKSLQTLAIYTNTVTNEQPAFGKTSDLSFVNNDTPMTLALGDVNNDGASDLAVGFGKTSGFTPTRNRIFFNDGRARFNRGDAQLLGPGTDPTFAVALADLNDDGRLDLIAANYQDRHGIYFTAPAAPRLTFAASQVGQGDHFASVAIGDLDGDHAPDIVAGVAKEPNETPVALTCLRNRGDLNISPPVAEDCGIPTTAYSLALADLDNAKGLDIVVGSVAGTPDYVVYNDGHGHFAARAPLLLSTTVSGTESVAVADLNNDEWPDIVAGSKRQSAIYLNDGQGGFSAAIALGGPTDPTISMAIGNLNNNDIWPDIVVGNDQAANAVYFNDGTGHFAAKPKWPFGSEFEGTRSLALGDLDRDGDLDLVVANFYAPNVVYFNDGSGQFTSERATYLGTIDNKTYSVALGDFDGDGALDIVAGTWATGPDIEFYELNNVVYLNNGRGGFSDANTVVLTRGKHFTRAVAVGDLNGDRKPDIVFADRYDPNGQSGRLMVYTNRLRDDVRASAQTIRLVPSGPITDVQGLAITHTLAYSLTAPNGGCDFRGMLEVSLDDK